MILPSLVVAALKRRCNIFKAGKVATIFGQFVIFKGLILQTSNNSDVKTVSPMYKRQTKKGIKCTVESYDCERGTRNTVNDTTQ